MRGLILSILFVFATPAFADNSAHYDELLEQGLISSSEHQLLNRNSVVLKRMKAYKSPAVKKTKEDLVSKLQRWEELHATGILTDEEYIMLLNNQKILNK